MIRNPNGSHQINLAIDFQPGINICVMQSFLESVQDRHGSCAEERKISHMRKMFYRRNDVSRKVAFIQSMSDASRKFA